MWTVEAFMEEWTLVAEAPDEPGARLAFESACKEFEGCAVILRGLHGEVHAKRSVLPPRGDE